MSTPRLILASSSPQRRHLLTMLGLEFEVVPSEFPEESVQQADFAHHTDFVSTIAAGKVLEVVGRLQLENQEDVVVIGGDLLTFTPTDFLPLGKPRDFSQARTFLHSLSGQLHTEICGHIIWSKSTGVLSQPTVTEVYFPSLTDQEMEQYLQMAKPTERAGGFHLVSAQKLLQKRTPAETVTISPSVTTVIGLDVVAMADLLTAAGVRVPVDAEQLESQIRHDILGA